MNLPGRFILARCLFPVVMLLCLNSAYAQQQRGIFGLVRDNSGAALPGISLVLTDNAAPATSLHAITDQLGKFNFQAIPPGTYHLSTDPPTYLIAPNAPLTISATSPALHLDLTLTRTGESPTKPAALQLQAAGIRGYIDPGGYSAPAGAAAASKLIQDAADLNRTDHQDTSAAACEREPALLKAALDHPDNAAAQRDLGQFYLATHRPEKAVVSLQRAKALNARDVGTSLSFVEALLQTRQFAAAHDLLAAEEVTGAHQASIHRLLARSDEGLGAFQQASLEYQTAATLEPSEADVYGAGYELILAGSAAAAVKAFDSGMVQYPASTKLLMGLGTAEFLLGQNAEATRVFLRCATLHPTDARLYPFLSASFAISGVDSDAVEAAFRNYYEISRTSADAAYFYAVILIHQNSAATTPLGPEALLKRAIQLDPSFAKAHVQLGSVYFDRGEFAPAAEEFAAGLRLDPALWETHYKLSQAYKRVGQSNMAAQQMQIFLAKKAENTSDGPSSDIHLEQFLSVFDRSASNPHAVTACTDKR